MTPLPKKKHTRARRGKRWGANKLSLPNLVFCPKCKKVKLPHVKCRFCGYYHNSTNLSVAK